MNSNNLTYFHCINSKLSMILCSLFWSFILYYFTFKKKKKSERSPNLPLFLISHKINWIHLTFVKTLVIIMEGSQWMIIIISGCIWSLKVLKSPWFFKREKGLKNIWISLNFCEGALFYFIVSSFLYSIIKSKIEKLDLKEKKNLQKYLFLHKFVFLYNLLKLQNIMHVYFTLLFPPFFSTLGLN